MDVHPCVWSEYFTCHGISSMFQKFRMSFLVVSMLSIAINVFEAVFDPLIRMTTNQLAKAPAAQERAAPGGHTASQASESV